MLLAVPSLTNTKDEREEEMETIFGDFPDFSGNLLDSIDFDDLFNDGDVLPYLEMDPEMLADFSLSSSHEGSDMNTSVSLEKLEEYNPRKEEEDKVSGSGSGSGLDSCLSTRGEEIVSKRDESSGVKVDHKGRKSSSQSKNPQGKRKVKVDWTPELHRRFVQAVEQLGVDKAVPSRILELMGIDCLTRHNIASHLQKYRSHRKHLLAREAEAASWSQRRQMYGTATSIRGSKREVINQWVAPTMGFPPPVTHMHHPFRPPLHVWGHPSIDPTLMHVWPKHPTPSPSPPPPPPLTWAPAPPPPPPDPSYWHPQHQRVPNGVTPGTPCFPPPMATTRFAAPPVPGIPPPANAAMYKVDPSIGTLPNGQSSPHPPFDLHPSKESIDSTIGDVLSKPWLPLPIGLKPPALDSVLVELQRQGIPKIPPTCT